MFTWRYDSGIDEESRSFGYPTRIGDPVADKAMIESVTSVPCALCPVLHAERIKAPLMLAFGGAHWRAPLVHDTRMCDALHAAGHPTEWVAYPDEGHCWLKLETCVEFANRMTVFLAKHLK